MIRLFEQHRVRRQRELEGMWKFVREDGKEYELPVPGVWEQHPELMNYRGKGAGIVLSTRDCCYYIYSDDKEFNPTRLQFAGEYYYQKER